MSYRNDDDDNEKYSKIKISNDRLSRKVFVFIALAYTIAAYVCLVNSKSTSTSSTSTSSTSIASIGDVEHNAGSDELHSTSTEYYEKDGDGYTDFSHDDDDDDAAVPQLDDVIEDELVTDLTKGELNENKREDMAHPVSTTTTAAASERLSAAALEKLFLDKKVRDKKATGVIMETDDKSLKLTKNLQNITDLTKGELKENKREGKVHPVSNTTTAAASEKLSLEGPSLKYLEKKRLNLDQRVRDKKATGVIMETDAQSLKLTKYLQKITRILLTTKYGDYEQYRVKVDLEFQSSIPDFDTNGPNGTLVIEMAPISILPVSVYNWLEIARTWNSGAFHRNADHVLQATTDATDVTQPLSFQEYSEEYPHTKGTVGYCGRPSGPCWYINIIDNTENHGRGSQQDENPQEADANFGRIVEGLDDVVPRIHSIPQKDWLDEKNQVLIKTMTILVPKSGGGGGDFVEWKPSLQ